MSCGWNEKCCDFRAALLAGVGDASLAMSVNQHLDNIRKEVMQQVQWDKQTNGANSRKNAMALVLIKKMLAELLGGNKSKEKLI